MGILRRPDKTRNREGSKGPSFFMNFDLQLNQSVDLSLRAVLNS